MDLLRTNYFLETGHENFIWVVTIQIYIILLKVLVSEMNQWDHSQWGVYMQMKKD